MVFWRVVVDFLDIYIKILWYYYYYGYYYGYGYYYYYYGYLIKNDMFVLYRCILNCYGYILGVDVGILLRGSLFWKY